MKSITIHRISLQFEANQITHGTPEEQANEALDMVNTVLLREMDNFGAQIITVRDEIEVEFEECKSCEGRGWLAVDIGNDVAPRREVQRCGACMEYPSDYEARKAARG